MYQAYTARLVSTITLFGINGIIQNSYVYVQFNLGRSKHSTKRKMESQICLK